MLEEFLGSFRLTHINPLVLLLDVPHLHQVVEDGSSTVAGREAPLEVHVINIPVAKFNFDGWFWWTKWIFALDIFVSNQRI
ncbi:MAG: hypothetical protein CMJ52_10485 [Planctomycetaceae bacterium]|nr:hypothetical protein [Planctomycetaceae bacterium]